MLTEQIQNRIAQVEVQSSHALALIAALGNPSEWSFTGEVNDAGNSPAECACGHPIRYCYVIAHPKQGTTHVGSTCIDHIASISPALGDQLIAAREVLEKSLSDVLKKAKRAAADAANAQLWAEYCTLRDQIISAHKDTRSRGCRSEREVWYFAEGYYEEYRRFSPPAYTRAGDLRKWLEKAIARCRSIITPAIIAA